MTDQMEMQDIASGGAYLILQAIDTRYSAEYRIGLLDKAVQLITDIRDQLVLEMAGMDACRDAPPDV